LVLERRHPMTAGPWCSCRMQGERHATARGGNACEVAPMLARVGAPNARCAQHEPLCSAEGHGRQTIARDAAPWLDLPGSASHLGWAWGKA
jgi:hypothetical protein